MQSLCIFVYIVESLSHGYRCRLSFFLFARRFFVDWSSLLFFTPIHSQVEVHSSKFLLNVLTFLPLVSLVHLLKSLPSLLSFSKKNFSFHPFFFPCYNLPGGNNFLFYSEIRSSKCLINYVTSRFILSGVIYILLINLTKFFFYFPLISIWHHFYNNYLDLLLN